METKLSTKGQVVLPGPIRRQLSLQPGDSFDAKVQAGRIMLTPWRKRKRHVRIVVDRITNLPVLSGGHEAPLLTSRHVREILSEFP
jgi:AbrB family looped-hinge helix DNA binding protein